MMILKMRSVRYMKFLSLPRYKNLYPFVSEEEQHENMPDWEKL